MIFKVIFLTICCLWLGCILSAFTERIQIETLNKSKTEAITRCGFPVWWKERNKDVYPDVKYYKLRLIINSALWSIIPLGGLLWLVKRTQKRLKRISGTGIDFD